MKAINIQLNFLLERYQNEAALPGVLASHANARKTMKELLDQARIDSARKGFLSPEVAEEAVSLFLEQVAESNIHINFQSQKGIFQHYVHIWLRRTVLKIAKEHWGNRTYPITELVETDDLDPKKAAEMEDLGIRCSDILFDTTLETSAAIAKSIQYVRKHRCNKKRWAKIAHLFPGMRLRPLRRQKKAKSVLSGAREILK